MKRPYKYYKRSVRYHRPISSRVRSVVRRGRRRRFVMR